MARLLNYPDIHAEALHQNNKVQPLKIVTMNKRPHPLPRQSLRPIAALLLLAFCPLHAKGADAAMTNQSSQTNQASLLERYPLADTIQDSPFLKQRAPFRFDESLPKRVTPYPEAIRSSEFGYQMGNQFFRRGILRRKGMTPSLGQFLFGPAAIPEFEKAALEKQGYLNQGYLVADIGNLEIKDAGDRKIKLDGLNLLFRPHVLETEFGAAGINVKVSSAIDFSDMLEVKIVLTSDAPVTLSLSGSMNQPGKWYPEPGMHLGQSVFKYVVGVDFSSSVEMKTSWMEEPLGYRVELAPSTRAELVLRFKPGYRGQDVRAALLSQRASDLSVAERSYREFTDFFARVVPPFACSDQRLVDLYYFNAYAIRCAMVDIPFEPYLYPYLPYAKNYYGILAMWPENVTTDMLFVRWLNDASFKEALLRKAMYQPDSPTLHPLPIGYKERLDHWDYRNLLATYEFAKTSANQQLVEQIKQLIREYAEKPLLNPWAEGMLCARDKMLAQYDDSLRYKVFFKGEEWLGWRSQMNQPLAHIEENSWYYQILRMAAAFARADGDPSAQQLEDKAERVRSAINAFMWDDDVGFYFDYATKDGKRSDVMSVAAFSTFWAGVPDRAQADRLIKEHLTNPAEFWGEWVLPATSMADPRTNPRGYVDGGIILDVNNWFPFQGLLKMGYRDVAEELFWRTIRLMYARGMQTWACDMFTADDGSPMSSLCPDAGVAMDMMLRCTTGFVPRSDDLFEFDPLILGAKVGSLDWGPYLYKKNWIQVHWRADDKDLAYSKGLTIRVNAAEFKIDTPQHILLRMEEGELKSVPVVSDPLANRKEQP